MAGEWARVGPGTVEQRPPSAGPGPELAGRSAPAGERRPRPGRVRTARTRPSSRPRDWVALVREVESRSPEIKWVTGYAPRREDPAGDRGGKSSRRGPHPARGGRDGSRRDGPGPEGPPLPEWPYALWDRPTSSVLRGASFIRWSRSGSGPPRREPPGLPESAGGSPSCPAERVGRARMCPRIGLRLRCDIPGNCGLSTLWTSARAMHGTQKVARDWVGLLERLTGRQDLHLLTWLGWAHAIRTPSTSFARRAPGAPLATRTGGARERSCTSPCSGRPPRCRLALGIRRPWWTAVPSPIAGRRVSCGSAPALDRAIVRGVAAGWATHLSPTRDSYVQDRTRSLRELWRATAVGELLAIPPGADAVPRRDGLRDVLSEAVRTRTMATSMRSHGC